MQYCSSASVINDRDEILLVYHKKLRKYVQPGGHIEENEKEWETAVRETKEETGIDIEIIDNEPFKKEIYHNHLGTQVDYQFYAIPINLDIVSSSESLDAGWFSLSDIDEIPIFDDIKDKFIYLLEKKGELKGGKRKSYNIRRS